MNIVNGYMDEAERADFLEYEKADIAYNRALLAYETFCDMRELRLRDIELKCMMESGTYDDLQAYYEAEEKENEDKSKGLVGNLWEAICNLFRTIKNFLFGDNKAKLEKAAEENPDKNIDVDQSVTGIWGLIKDKINIFKKLSSGDVSSLSDAGEVGKFIAENGGKIAGFATAAGVTTGITLKFAWEIYSGLSTIASSISSFTEKHKSDGEKLKDKIKDGALEGLKKVGSTIHSAAKLILKAVPKDVLDKKAAETDEKIAKHSGNVEDLKKQIADIDKQIENEKDEEKKKELQNKKADLEKQLEKAQGKLNKKQTQRNDIDETTGKKREKTLKKISKNCDKYKDDLEKEKNDKKTSDEEKQKIDKDLKTFADIKSKVESEGLNGSKSWEEIIGSMSVEFESELGKKLYNKINSNKDDKSDKEENTDNNENNDNNDSEGKEEDKNESVQDILGFEIPESFMMEGSVEDDQREILDLFDTLLGK